MISGLMLFKCLSIPPTGLSYISSRCRQHTSTIDSEDTMMFPLLEFDIVLYRLSRSLQLLRDQLGSAQNVRNTQMSDEILRQK